MPDAIINTDINSNYLALQTRIVQACAAVGRPVESVTLIGASKTRSHTDVRTAYAAGVKHFGENYLDEAQAKIAQARDLDTQWHFIGRIQSNKTRPIAELFHWVHTVDRERIAQRLNDQCPADKTLQVLIQVNIDGDPAKAGVAPEACATLLKHINTLPQLRPRGLMTILARDHNPAASYQSMAELHQSLAVELPDISAHWDCLSMGMTADLEAAIAAGATHIRIGTALFGARDG